MSDPEQFAHTEGNDIVPELPQSPSIAAAYGNAAAVNHKNSPRPSHHHSPLERHNTRGSVDVDFFDPAGVNELRRELTRMSTREAEQGSAEERKSSVVSEDTLTSASGTFDFEKYLREFMAKAEESGVKHRELGVMFKDLRVVGLGASARHQATLGSMLNPLSILKTIDSIRHPALRDILSGFEGVVRPGEMLLVLGRPEAGCSTLLRALANHRKDYYAVEGEVHYDSFTPEEISKHYRGDVQYCPEDDVHFPTLTVAETLAFAAKSRTPRTRMGAETRDEHVDRVVDILSTIFGLKRVRDTLVGDASIRGVSGGEKKRVSIAEALATLSRLNSWDNSTRGLDASTALEFVQALRISTDVAHQATVVSIYQAGETLYELFDKVCVIYEGKMAYFGPAYLARQYFIDMGYQPANRQTTADFLVAVTDVNGRIIRPGFESRVPRTAAEFAEYFKKSNVAQTNRDDMESYKEQFVGKEHRIIEYQESVQAARAKHTNPKSSYITSIPMQARALMVRRFQILKGGYAAQVILLVIFVVQAIIIGTVFLKLEDTTATFFSRGGVLFFSILFSALTTMAEIPALFAQRPIVLRHSRAAMYHPFVESLALTLVDLPIAAAILGLFSIVLYFLVDLNRTAGHFFIFLLFLFSMMVTMKAWFRALAAAFNDPAPAQTVAGIAVLMLTLYTGYTIPQPSMIGALRWITYINPLKYGFESLMVNEFHSRVSECATLIPQGPGYEGITLANQVCTTVGSVAGQPTVSGNTYVELSFKYSFSHLWRNFGILWCFAIGFLVIYFALTEIKNGSVGESAATEFKRGSKTAAVKEAKGELQGNDEEKGSINPPSTIPDTNKQEMKAAVGDAPVMTDIFSWQHLAYTVPLSHGNTRRLLDDVSGYVAPGKLTALMGASGAGKTTLLNVLAERASGGVVAGDRFVNGQLLPSDFQAQTGYCQQMDTHLQTTTVREALLFSAKLRQPASVPMKEKEEYVEKCLKMCGLAAYADAIVGSLNVEMKKRTTIAVELAAKPRLLLFLDEPTSGLDSQSAWAIMAFLRSLADSGQAILCTIHQPSAELFSVFDRLLLLRPGGQTVYFGDVGSNCETLINYFHQNGARQCDSDENPAEYMLTAIGAGATARSDIDWHETWRKSKEAAELQQEIDSIHTEGRSRPPNQAVQHSEFATSWTYQVATLFKRDCEAHWRDPVYLLSKIALNVCAGLFIGFTFFKAKDSLQGTQNKLFSIFMGTIISVPLAAQLQVSFINMRSIYEIRERPSRIYSWTALITSQILAEVPWNILGSSLFFLCWYWTVGLPTARGGYTFLMMGVANPLYYTTIGQAAATMAPNAEIAALLFSFLFSFVLTFNGVLQPFSQLGWWQWMYRLSPYTYLIEGLLGQAIGKQEITCASLEYVHVNPPSGQSCSAFLQPFIDRAGGYITNPGATSACEYCSFRTADQFLLTSFNISYSHHWRNFGIFMAYVIFNISAVYVFMYIFRIRSGNSLRSLKDKLSSLRRK